MTKLRLLLSAVCAILPAITTMSVNAALIGRLETSPGSGIFQAYYDDQLDITWAADANIDDFDDWPNQVALVAGLTIDGVGGWRLPNMDINGDGSIVSCSSNTQAACKDNEYGHLFFYGAGTILGSGVTSASPGPFSNVQSFYWSGTEFTPFPPTDVWVFDFESGSQFVSPDNDLFVWAVRSGDVGVVPVPATAWLFGSALGLLTWIRRRVV